MPSDIETFANFAARALQNLIRDRPDIIAIGHIIRHRIREHRYSATITDVQMDNNSWHVEFALDRDYKTFRIVVPGAQCHVNENQVVCITPELASGYKCTANTFAIVVNTEEFSVNYGTTMPTDPAFPGTFYDGCGTLVSMRDADSTAQPWLLALIE